MAKRTPLDVLFVEARRLTFKAGRATPADLASLRRAADKAYLSGLSEPVSCLLHWAAEVHARSFSDDSLAALHAAVRLQSRMFAREADADTPEADPDYWWQKGAMA